jgi:hypothetical protein
VWVDVVIPVDDPLWRDDVATAFDWLGDAWADVVRRSGVAGEVNRLAVCHSVLGRLVCFAGLGFGEVTVDGRKAVGLAQRRTRHGAWFQGVVLRAWDVEPYRALLAPGLATITEDPAAELAAVALIARHAIEAADCGAGPCLRPTRRSTGRRALRSFRGAAALGDRGSCGLLHH